LLSHTPESWHKEFEHWYIVEIRRSNPFSCLAIPPSQHTWFGPMKKGKDLELSFSTEVITGWRAWQIVDFERRGNASETRIQALGTHIVWEPYQPGVAVCTTSGAHEAPWPDCRCGFWAFKDREYVERTLFDSYGGEKGKVIGQVALWGRVLECTLGYRGEYAYPQTFQFIEVDNKVAVGISELYGVPYSIVKRSVTLKCKGYIVSTEFDFDRLYATIQYKCGLEVRVEISRHWEGKSKLDLGNVPLCPEHHH